MMLDAAVGVRGMVQSQIARTRNMIGSDNVL